MDELHALRRLIRAAFADTPPPGPDDLRNSDEGDEPYLLEDEFAAVPDWRSIDRRRLDDAPGGTGSALSFFSDAAFRYYLPAYLLADVDGDLVRADPLFHLWHGLDDEKRDRPVNPRRYGSWTWFEAISGRLGGFTRAESEAVVAYMRWRADRDRYGFDRSRVEEALRSFWLPRLGEPPPG
jgi:hypothetical protein